MAIQSGESSTNYTAITAIVLVVLLTLRTAGILLTPLNLGPDEAQYWRWGQTFEWGYYSKPPLVAWLIRLSTEIFGDTAFGVRFFAPLIHAAIAWMIFATGRTLFDGRTGFWAALVYLAAPGVTVNPRKVTRYSALQTCAEA